MKSFNEYTIYCTKGQVEKSIKIGAPIEEAMSAYNTKIAYERISKNKKIEDEYINDGVLIIGNQSTVKSYNIPTAEQMCEWLRREKGLFIEPYLNGECAYSFSPVVCTIADGEIIHLKAENSYKEALLYSIDAALDYLIDHKQE